MKIPEASSTFCVCKCRVHLYRSRWSDKDLFSIGVASAGSIGYEAAERPWSHWRNELLRLSVRPEQLDRIRKTLLHGGQRKINLVGASPFDLQSIGFQPMSADQSPVSARS
jgi:hypothetical protein